MLDGPIFAQHLECFRVIAHNFALANKYFQFTYRGSAEFWAIIEALTRAAYEAKAQDYIVWPLVNSMIRKNCIIDRNWINKVLADMKSRADTDKHLIYIVKSCSPRLVERENYREMLDFAQNLLQKMELGVSPEMPSHMKDVMLKVLKTKTRQFSNALALMKSPEERHAYEEQMLLELD
jgi:hypothetical protein